MKIDTSEPLTEAQDAVIQDLYEELVRVAGVTLIYPNLAVRLKSGTVHLTISGVNPNAMFIDECYTCGAQNGLRDANVEITHANGSKKRFKVLTCADCRCPK